MKDTGISENALPLAVEDRFVIVAIRRAPHLCPSSEDGNAIALALRHARGNWRGLVPLFDFRGLGGFYEDVREFVSAVAADEKAHVLVRSDNEFLEWKAVLEKEGNFSVIPVRGRPQSARVLDLNTYLGKASYIDGDRDRSGLEDMADQIDSEIELAALNRAGLDAEELILNTDEDEYEDQVDRLLAAHPPSAEEIAEIAAKEILGHFSHTGGRAYQIPAHGLVNSFRELISSLQDRTPRSMRALRDTVPQYILAAYFHAFLRRIHAHSVLVEFAMWAEGDIISCVPYHSGAVHEIEMPAGRDLIVGRPGIIGQITRCVFSDEIRMLEGLLNDQHTKERDLQRFFEQHPSFLRGLNYKNIYPQLVLQRDDGSQLKPDFILEPFEGGWCDILDIKLPKQKIIVGRGDRKALASGIHEVVAQLREYAAYFEERKHRTYVQEKYGLRVYKPRLVALVGRDLAQMSSPQLRRAMTHYENCQILTFDDLITHSKNRLLI